MYRRWNEFQGAPKAVTLLYDRTNGVIGLKLAEPDAPNAFPVKGKQDFQNLVIHGKPFFRHHEIETDRTITFNGVEADEGILLLDLATVTAVTRRKATA